MPEEGLLSQFKQLIVGKPIPSHLAHHERLSRFTGLAVLSSDPLSSVAYATEEILRVLILVGVGALSLSSPIAFVIATILAVVVFSYRQTIHAYPSGGGAYIVAKDNLGETPALIAAGALFSVLLSAGVETPGPRRLLGGLGFSAGFFFFRCRQLPTQPGEHGVLFAGCGDGDRAGMERGSWLEHRSSSSGEYSRRLLARSSPLLDCLRFKTPRRR